MIGSRSMTRQMPLPTRSRWSRPRRRSARRTGRRCAQYLRGSVAARRVRRLAAGRDVRVLGRTATRGRAPRRAGRCPRVEGIVRREDGDSGVHGGRVRSGPPAFAGSGARTTPRRARTAPSRPGRGGRRAARGPARRAPCATARHPARPASGRRPRRAAPPPTSPAGAAGTCPAACSISASTRTSRRRSRTAGARTAVTSRGFAARRSRAAGTGDGRAAGLERLAGAMRPQAGGPQDGDDDDGEHRRAVSQRASRAPSRLPPDAALRRVHHRHPVHEHQRAEPGARATASPPPRAATARR